MKSLRVHRINFYEPIPQAIRCLSYDKVSSYLAVSRADSSIEIWDMKVNPFLEKVLPGTTNSSVETITWCKGRLFSAGLNGSITEHDLTTVLPKSQFIATSGCPVWCMVADKKQKYLAIGNEDGHVVLYYVSPEGLDFEKKFDKQEGSILCLDWHKNGQVIVTGSSDAIRIWNVNTGHVVNRILLERLTKFTPTIVWSIACKSDMTIISGDSCGKTSFWDGNTGTLLSSTCTGAHKEDILTLTVSEEEDVIYASGVDPTITMYLKSESNGKWMKSIQRVVHTHDVRALKLVGDFLVSGGDDCNLVFTKYPPKTTVKFFPFCQKSYAQMATDASLILLKYPSFIEVWKIRPSSCTDNNTEPSNLLRVKPKENENVICSAISSNGKWLAYSSQFQVRLFHLKLDTDSDSLPSLYKTSLPDKVSPSVNHILFTSEPVKLVTCAQKKVSIVDCNTLQSTLETTIDITADFDGEINMMELSPDDSYLALSSHDGNIKVYDLRSCKLFCKLPCYKCQSAALKFNPTSESLIAVYSDRKVIEYCLKKQAYTSWSKQQNLLEFQTASYHPVSSVCFLADKLYLQDENAIYVFNRDKEMRPVKKRVKQSNNTSLDIVESGYQTITKYEHISSIHSFAEDLVVVEMSASRVLDCLPPPVWKKKYGT